MYPIELLDEMEASRSSMLLATGLERKVPGSESLATSPKRQYFEFPCKCLHCLVHVVDLLSVCLVHHVPGLERHRLRSFGCKHLCHLNEGHAELFRRLLHIVRELPHHESAGVHKILLRDPLATVSEETRHLRVLRIGKEALIASVQDVQRNFGRGERQPTLFRLFL